MTNKLLPIPIFRVPAVFLLHVIQNGEQALVAVYLMVAHVAGGNLIEQLSGAVNLGLLDAAKIQADHRTLGFSNEENVLHSPIMEGDGPVRGVIAHGGGDVEALRELCIDTDLVGGIQILGKLTLNALFRCSVGEHIILDCLGGMEGLVKALAALFGGKDVVFVGTADLVVGNMIHDHRGLLFVDELDDLGDELLRIVLEHQELISTESGQNSGDSSAGQNGSFCDFAHQIILYGAGMGMAKGLGAGFGGFEGIAPSHFVTVHLRLLLAHGGGVLKLRDHQLVVHMGDGLLNKLFAVEGHRVGVLAVDLVPEGLEFLLIEVVVEGIVLDLGIVAVGDHILQNRLVEDGLNELVDAIAHVGNIQRQRSQCARS